jgi:hypothetical protein
MLLSCHRAKVLNDETHHVIGKLAVLPCTHLRLHVFVAFLFLSMRLQIGICKSIGYGSLRCCAVFGLHDERWKPKGKVVADFVENFGWGWGGTRYASKVPVSSLLQA